MIKVTYYVGMNDKDTCKKELLDRDFNKVFDELFVNYTLQYAQGVYTMQNNETVVREDTLIVTTFIDECNEVVLRQHIQHNCSILKEKLNQELILVEVTEPKVLFC